MKLGRFVWIIWVTYCPSQAGVTWFIKYLGLTLILHWITCINNGVWSWSKSKELSVLDCDDGNTSPDSPQDIWKDWPYNYSILIIRCLYNAQPLSCHFIIIKIKQLLIRYLHSYLWPLIEVALIQHEKCYTSHPVGETPNLWVREYLQINLSGICVWLIIYRLYLLYFALASKLCSNTNQPKCRFQHTPLLWLNWVSNLGQWCWPSFNPG